MPQESEAPMPQEVIERSSAQLRDPRSVYYIYQAPNEPFEPMPVE